MKLPERVLAVNLNQLGDALFTTPALALLRERLPDAHIDVQAGGRAASVLAGNRDIDHLYARPPRRGMSRNAALLRTLRAGRYDAVILFQSNLSYAILARAAGVPVRVGFAQNACGPFLTRRVPPARRGEHLVASYVRLIDAFCEGGEVPAAGHLPLKVAVSAADHAFADGFLREQGLTTPVVALVIGTTRPQKRWPEEYWSVLADRLWDACGARSLLIGGPDETAEAARIRAAARFPLVSAVGHTDMKQLAALLSRCSVVVTGDSGPMHLATAVGTPVVALFGSTDPKETGPWHGAPDHPVRGSVLYDALPCAPCGKSPTCGGRFDCLRGLTPERVFAATASTLGVGTWDPLPVTPTTGGV